MLHPSGLFDFDPGPMPSWDLNALVQKGFSIAFAVAGIVAVGFFIMGGYKVITAAGDANKMQEGTTTITNAIIGLVIISLAGLIVNFIAQLLWGGPLIGLDVLLN